MSTLSTYMTYNGIEPERVQQILLDELHDRDLEITEWTVIYGGPIDDVSDVPEIHPLVPAFLVNKDYDTKSKAMRATRVMVLSVVTEDPWK